MVIILIANSLKAKSARAYKNLVTNGNFVLDSNSDGLADDWLYYAIGILSLFGGIQKFTATAQYGGISQQKTYSALTHKFYACGDIKANSNQVSFRAYDGVILGSVSHSGSGNFEHLSVIMTANNGTYISTYTNDERTSGWAETQIQNVQTIDLTATFGAGNEHTQAWCDAFLTFIP